MRVCQVECGLSAACHSRYVVLSYHISRLTCGGLLYLPLVLAASVSSSSSLALSVGAAAEALCMDSVVEHSVAGLARYLFKNERSRKTKWTGQAEKSDGTVRCCSDRLCPLLG